MTKALDRWSVICEVTLCAVVCWCLVKRCLIPSEPHQAVLGFAALLGVGGVPFYCILSLLIMFPTFQTCLYARPFPMEMGRQSHLGI